MKRPLFERQALAGSLLRSGPVTLGLRVELRSDPDPENRTDHVAEKVNAKLHPFVSCHW